MASVNELAAVSGFSRPAIQLRIDRFELKPPILGKDVFDLKPLEGKREGVTLEEARKRVLEPLTFAAFLLRSGDCQAAVAGSEAPTADVLRPGIQIVGRTYGDRGVFRAAAAYEQALGGWYASPAARPRIEEGAEKIQGLPGI